MEIMRNGFMQKVLYNKTHVLVVELEGVLVPASQRSHVLQVGGGDRQGVINVPRRREHPPLLLGPVLLLLDVVDRRPQLRGLR